MTPDSEQTGVADPLWPTWRALVAEFGMLRLLRQLATSRSGWGIYGADVISTLGRTAMARAGARVLADVPDELLIRLQALASLNARRNEAMWRMSALFYATVPFTLLLAGMQGAPQIVREVLGISLFLTLSTVVLLTIWLLLYFANNWRARQIEAVVELVRIERGTREAGPYDILQAPRP